MTERAKEILLHIYSIGYRITKEGLLIRRDKLIGTQKSSGGYRVFKTSKQGKNIQTTIHQLQAYQKFGELLFKEGIQVRHLDGNYLNNHFENISIGTQSDNNYDIPKIVRIEKAMKGAAKVRKFDKETVEAIRVEKIKGASLSFLSKKYSAAKSTMSYIINRKTYSS